MAWHVLTPASDVGVKLHQSETYLSVLAIAVRDDQVGKGTAEQQYLVLRSSGDLQWLSAAKVAGVTLGSLSVR
jgi:hypothetical protein